MAPGAWSPSFPRAPTPQRTLVVAPQVRGARCRAPHPLQRPPEIVLSGDAESLVDFIEAAYANACGVGFALSKDPLAHIRIELQPRVGIAEPPPQPALPHPLRHDNQLIFL